MGVQNVAAVRNEEGTRRFERALLDDLEVLERMLQSGIFETGVRRIGAEQEVFLIDQEMRPASVGETVLALLQDRRYTMELARFNLEINATPREFKGKCFRDLHTELAQLLRTMRERCLRLSSMPFLNGILPTLRIGDLTLENMTQSARYQELNQALMEKRGNDFVVHIKGVDELLISHPSMMLEACNTSFQVHYQVEPSHFASMYNLAQAVSAPLLAAAVNSPLLFQKRLWHETRLALFQHSIDERNLAELRRFRPTRATFGEGWVRESVLEIYREDIARFRPVLICLPEDSPEGTIPKLSALCLHNGTVWRWNRPCYGILDGVPHLRIENRVLPSGPTVVDEIANAAFFCGMLAGMEKEHPQIHTELEFHQATANFYSAARHGLNAQFEWLRGKSVSASELIREELLPIARMGLATCGVDEEEAAYYLDIIQQRVERKKTGAQWMLDSWNQLRKELHPQESSRVLTESILKHQSADIPVHLWDSMEAPSSQWKAENYRYVEQVMSTNLYTVQPDDLVDLAASIMEWAHIRHLPVEDRQGRLVGLITQRDLARLLSKGKIIELMPIHQVMKRNPIVVSPDSYTLVAMEIMRNKRVGCLPVVENEQLVGILTTFDLLGLSHKLLTKNLL